jgi:hypothetical protein
MSKLTFLTIVTLVAAILFPSVIANTFAKSSDGDSGGGSGNDDKPKTSGYKKGDDGGSGGMPVPGVPVVRADDKHRDKDSKGGTGGFPVPGVPAVRAGGSDDDNGGSGGVYNNNNIKKFDTSKSILRSAGSHGSKIIEYTPGFNETFYNSTLPYCYAVTAGTCYDSSTGHIIP